MSPYLHEGIAIGGPRDGVKLSAGLGWDGAIRLPGTSSMIRWYPGRYKWNAELNTWEWEDIEQKKSCTGLPLRPSLKPFIGY